MTNQALKIKIAAKTDVGKVREHNEDNYVVCPDLNKNEWYLINEDIHLGENGALLVIADGMGGMNAGEIASALSIESIRKYFSDLVKREPIIDDSKVKELLFGSVLVAQEEISKYVDTHSEAKGMGTTIVISWVKNNIIHTAWVGDSRCYILRNNKDLFFATKDHSYVQELVDANKITQEQAFYHPESNIITRSLGDGSGKKSEPDYACFQLESNDRVMMCTDGLNGMLQDQNITEVLNSCKDIQECSAALITAANDAGGHDNISVILCDIISLSNSVKNEVQVFNKLLMAASIADSEIIDNPHPTISPSSGPIILPDKLDKKPPRSSLMYLLFLIPIAVFAYIFFYSSVQIKKNSPAKIIRDSANINNLNKLKNNDSLSVSSEKKKEKLDTSLNNSNSNKQLNKPNKSNPIGTDGVGKNKITSASNAGSIITEINNLTTIEKDSNAQHHK